MKVTGFISQHDAEKVSGNKRLALISITSSGEADIKEGWGDLLRLQFDDIDDGEDPKAFNEEHAAQIIDFVKRNEDKDGVIVHCLAGISRSAAVSRFIADIYKLPFNKHYSLYNKFVYRKLHETLDKRS